MSDQEFLKKYGSEKVYFEDIFKLIATYKNEDLKIWCSGLINDHDIITKTESVNDISNLDYFKFGLLTKKLNT